MTHRYISDAKYFMKSLVDSKKDFIFAKKIILENY